MTADEIIVGLIALLAIVGCLVFAIRRRTESEEARIQRLLGMNPQQWQKHKQRVTEQHAAHRAKLDKQDAEDQLDPPWLSPRPINQRDHRWAFSELMGRLSPVFEHRLPPHNEPHIYYRDTDTGQLWHHYEEEMSYGNWVAYLHPAKNLPTDATPTGEGVDWTNAG